VLKLDEEEMEDFSAHLQNEGFFSDPEGMKRAFREKTHFSAE